MGFKTEIYEIVFTEDSKNGIKEIYDYISNNLVNEEAAKRLMRKIKEKVLNLSKTPKLYKKIEKTKKIKREFRRMIVNNYVILYTVDDDKKIVYISHMYYKRKDYL